MMLDRRALMTFTAAIALGGGVVALGTPDPANAACAEWKLGDKPGVPVVYYGMFQSNRWKVNLVPSQRQAVGFPPGYSGDREDLIYGRLTITSFTAALVKFTIGWGNGSGGVYTGTIDSNGFVSGTSVDRWHPQSRASWRLLDTADCVR